MESQCAGSNCVQVRLPRICARRRVSCASSASCRATTTPRDFGKVVRCSIRTNMAEAMVLRFDTFFLGSTALQSPRRIACGGGGGSSPLRFFEERLGSCYARGKFKVVERWRLVRNVSGLDNNSAENIQAMDSMIKANIAVNLSKSSEVVRNRPSAASPPSHSNLTKDPRRRLSNHGLIICEFGWWKLLNALLNQEGETVYIDLENDTKLSPAQKQVLINNLKIQRQNRVPQGFPSFVREGFDIKVLANGFTQDESGLIYKDYKIGDGPYPQDLQQVTFEYTGFNESGARIDSTYLKGYPAQTRLGLNGLIPGFELALKSMRVGGQRRVIIPPELGPPVGPQTFFSAKQCEVFDIELLDVKSCRRTQFAMFSGVTCE